jgi:hypothetical protein
MLIVSSDSKSVSPDLGFISPCDGRNTEDSIDDPQIKKKN